VVSPRAVARRCTASWGKKTGGFRGKRSHNHDARFPITCSCQNNGRAGSPSGGIRPGADAPKSEGAVFLFEDRLEGSGADGQHPVSGPEVASTDGLTDTGPTGATQGSDELWLDRGSRRSHNEAGPSAPDTYSDREGICVRENRSIEDARAHAESDGEGSWGGCDAAKVSAKKEDEAEEPQSDGASAWVAACR